MSRSGVAHAAVLLATLLVSPVAAAETPPLHLEGITFVASEGRDAGLVLRAERARFELDLDKVFLEQVHATLAEPNEEEAGASQRVEIYCDRGELDLESYDFYAEGNVTGRTDAGRRFSAPWVRFEQETGLLYTEAPVVIREDSGTYRGGGFRYLVRENRFRLIGGASVVQEQ